MMEHRETSLDIESLRAIADHGSFEETLQALEAAVAYLEQGRLALADAVAWYETGLALASRCSALLAQTELRIRSIEDAYQTFEDGAQSWDDDEA